MRIWIDIITPSQVHLFRTLIPELKNNQLLITSTQFAETTQLLKNFNMNSYIIGSHITSKGLYKNIKILWRLINLFFKVQSFDISLSFQNFYVPIITKMRMKKNITLLDNDIPSFDFKTILKFSDYIIIPEAIPLKKINKFIKNSTKIYRFQGYKENIYISNYTPDKNFLNQIPFREYVVVRPEALFAIYIKNKQSIVPKLISLLVEKKFNVIYLPRTQEDLKFVAEKSVYIPEKTLNGLDLCWYSQAVLTGSGTLAREAACMGVPAVSFFPEKLLSVDEELVKEGKIFHSRNVEEIVDYISKFKNKKISFFNKSKRIKSEVVNLINEILNEI